MVTHDGLSPYQKSIQELHRVKIRVNLNRFWCLQFSVQMQFVNYLKYSLFVFLVPLNSSNHTFNLFLVFQPMSTQELWQWVHYSYGDELGKISFFLQLANAVGEGYVFTGVCLLFCSGDW